MKSNIKYIYIVILSIFSINSFSQTLRILTQTELNQANIPSKVATLELGSLQSNVDKIYDLTPLIGLDSVTFDITIVNINATNLSALNNIKMRPSSFIIIWECLQLSDISAITNKACRSLEFKGLSALYQLPTIGSGVENLILKNMSGLSGNVSANFTKDRSYLVIDSCPNIISLSVQVKQDTNSEVYIRNNAKLETVNFNVVNPKNYIPTQYMEIIFYNRKTEFENNSKLSLISATNNYYGFTRFRAVENPLLDDLCIFKQSVKTTNEIFSATLQQDWNAQLKEGILGIRDNAPGANSIEEVIAKDCIALQEEEVEDEITAAPFGVYPNPYTGGALQLSGVKTGSAIAVYDMVGKLIYSTQYTGAAITLPPLNNGLYLVETTKVNGHKAYTKLYAE